MAINQLLGYHAFNMEEGGRGHFVKEVVSLVEDLLLLYCEVGGLSL